MKILMLCDFFNENLEYQENLLVKYYRKHGHDVTVVTSVFESIFDLYSDRYDKKAAPRTYVYNGAKIIKLQYRFNVLNRLRKYTPIMPILEAEKPDLIYVHDIMLNILECKRYMKKHPECRMIMDYHADYSNSAKNWVSLKILHGFIRRRFYLDRTKKYISKIFPIVPAGIDFLNEVYGVKVDDMEVLPLGADTDLANETMAKKEGLAIRKKLGIPENAFVVFTGGKLHANKKTEVIIDAVNLLGGSDIYLVIVGKADVNDEAYRQHLERIASSNGNIIFTGWLSAGDVYKYLDASDIAVFPASQSILWQQAISMNLPLVTGDIGGQSIAYLNKHDNIIIHEKNNINAETFAATIHDLITKPGLLQEMKDGAAKVSSEYLDWNRLIHKTLRFNATGKELS